jgi:hypothetical protein
MEILESAVPTAHCGFCTPGEEGTSVNQVCSRCTAVLRAARDRSVRERVKTAMLKARREGLNPRLVGMRVVITEGKCQARYRQAQLSLPQMSQAA